MPTSNLTRCYEGVQRIYRNAVVRHVRSIFVATYPDDHLERLKKPFQKEWAEIKVSAEERRKTGELAAQIIDEYDLLGVNHFFNLFDAHHDIICPAESGADAPSVKARKQALLAWIKQIKNLRDPLSHPSETDFSYEDSFLILDCARRVLVQLNLVYRFRKLKKEANRGAPARTNLDRKRSRESKMRRAAQPEAEPERSPEPPRGELVLRKVGRRPPRGVSRWLQST